MQNKQAIVGIVLAAVILLGAGGFFLYSRAKPPKPSQNTSTTKEEQKPAEVGGSIIDILKGGETQQCEFKSQEENVSTEGKVYLSNQNLRADLSQTDDGKKSEISMIRKGNDNYIWGSGFPANSGIKMTLSVDEFATDENTKDYFDPNKQVDYKCGPWVADETMFSPPGNIKFQDLSGFIAPTGTSSPTDTSSCSICNSLTGEAKSACLTSFNCQ